MTDVTMIPGDGADTADVWTALGAPVALAPEFLAEVKALENLRAPEPERTGPKGEDRVDWDEAFAEDFSEPVWMPGRLCEAGQLVTIVGAAKSGKSLFVLAWSYACVTGSEYLGTGTVEGKALRVLYFDMENNKRDVVTRLRSFGATADQLGEFHYHLFPQFSGAFDESDRAVAELMAVVDEVKPDVVVLDTVSRFVAGSENEADTYTALYRRALLPLKDRAVTVVRLDHMGKDETKGARGSSAKTNDVDHVWELTAGNPAESPEETVTNLKLKRSHTRTGIGPDLLKLLRRAVKDEKGMWAQGGTSITLAGEGTLAAGDTQDWAKEIEGVPYAVTRVAMALLDAGVPSGIGRTSLAKAANEVGIEIPGKGTTQAQIVREIKRLAPLRARDDWHDPEGEAE